MKLAVVGGGIVGATLAKKLSDNPMNQVTLIEKGPNLGEQQSGHNSGVVHAGIYYRSDSLKARLVQEGRTLLRDFCVHEGIPFEERGKIVVATNAKEIGALDELERRARSNGVPNLRRIGYKTIREIEPFAAGIEALHSPLTAVVDFPRVIKRVSELFVAQDGVLQTGNGVKRVRQRGNQAIVQTESGEESYDKVYICAGIYSDSLTTPDQESDYKLVPFRGEYLELSVEASTMVNGLIYPVPDPEFPFLGVHFTRGHNGDVHIGPNATLALAREGYSLTDVNFKELLDYGLWPGTRKLIFKNPSATWDQIMSSLSRKHYIAAAQKLVPDVRSHDLSTHKWSGVRAQALSKSGQLVDDFLFKKLPGIVVVQNAPSPAATASFAIANHIVDDLSL